MDQKLLNDTINNLEGYLNNSKKYIDTYNGRLEHIAELIGKRDKAQEDGFSAEIIAMYNEEINKQTKAVEDIKKFFEKLLNDSKRITGENKYKDISPDFLKEFLTFKIKWLEYENEKKRLQEEQRKENSKGTPNSIAESQKLQDKINKIITNQTSLENSFKAKSGYGETAIGTFKSDDKSQKTLEKVQKTLEEANIHSGEKNITTAKQIESDQTKAIKDLEEQYLQTGSRVVQTVKVLFGAVWNQVKDAGTMWMKFDDQATSTAKRLGMTSRSQSLAYTKNLLDSSKELAKNFGITAEQASKMRDSYVDATGRATLLSRSQMEDVVASSKLMGNETVQNAIKIMDSMGSTSQATVELMDKNYARAKASGLDITKASTELVKNLSLANKLNFKDGVDGISKMTIYSQRVKMDLQQVANVADKFSTIEGAIEGSAKLQVLGGQVAALGGNPMAMMYEALADPEALFKRVTDMFSTQAYFDRATGTSKIAPVQQAIMREQAKALGIDPEQAVQSAKQQAKLRDIEATIKSTNHELFNGLSDEQKAAIGNKAEYSKESGWTVTYFNEQTNQEETAKLTELTQQQIAQIAKEKEPVEDIRKHVRQIAGELVSLRERGTSMLDVFKMSKAELAHPVMATADEQLNSANRGEGLAGKAYNFITDGGWGTATAIAGSVGLGVASTIFGYKLKNLALTKIGKIFSGGSSVTPKPNVATGGGSTSGVGSALRQSKMYRKGRYLVGRALGRNKISLIREYHNIRRVKGGKRFGRINITDLNKARKIQRGVNSAQKTASAARATENARRIINAGKGLSTASKFAKGLYSLRSSALAPIAEIVGAGISFYSAGQERKSENKKLELKASQINSITGKSRYSKKDLENQDITSKNKEKVAKGGAIGRGTGALIGAAIGTIGGPLGVAAGAAIGGYIGKWVGKKLTPEENEGVVGERLKQINKDGVKDNLRRIILPVESIDYNVSLIANQLGIISARPARGNVYLDAELAGENQIESGKSFLGINSGTSEPNENKYNNNQKSVASAREVKNERIIKNDLYNYDGDVTIDNKRNSEIVNSQIQKEVIKGSFASNQTPSVNLNLSGSIDLNWKGMNVDKINSSDIIKLFESNQEIKNMLAETILNEYVKRGCGGRVIQESSWFTMGSGPGFNSMQVVGTDNVFNS